MRNEKGSRRVSQKMKTRKINSNHSLNCQPSIFAVDMWRLSALTNDNNKTMEVLFVFSLSCYRSSDTDFVACCRWLRVCTKRAGYACLNNFCHFFCIVRFRDQRPSFIDFSLFRSDFQSTQQSGSQLLTLHFSWHDTFNLLLFYLTWQWLVLQSSSHHPFITVRHVWISTCNLVVDEKCQVIRAKITKRMDRRTLRKCDGTTQ